MKCFYEPEQEASALCIHCGRALCADCLVESADQIFCKKGCYAESRNACTAVEVERQEHQLKLLHTMRSTFVVILMVLPWVAENALTNVRGLCLYLFGLGALMLVAYQFDIDKKRITAYKKKQNDITEVEVLIQSKATHKS